LSSISTPVLISLQALTSSIKPSVKLPAFQAPTSKGAAPAERDVTTPAAVPFAVPS